MESQANIGGLRGGFPLQSIHQGIKVYQTCKYTGPIPTKKREMQWGGCKRDDLLASDFSLIFWMTGCPANRSGCTCKSSGRNSCRISWEGIGISYTEQVNINNNNCTIYGTFLCWKSNKNVFLDLIWPLSDCIDSPGLIRYYLVLSSDSSLYYIGKLARTAWDWMGMGMDDVRNILNRAHSTRS